MPQETYMTITLEPELDELLARVDDPDTIDPDGDDDDDDDDDESPDNVDPEIQD
jgi:hypothetical protein